MNNPGKLQPALIGGAVLGVASAIPVLSCLNCACCALVVAGGMLAGGLYTRSCGPSTEAPYGDGALVGLMAGGIGAVVSAAISLPFQLLFSSFSWQPNPGDLADLEEALSDLPPEIANMVETMMGSFLGGGGTGVALGSMLFGLMVALIVYPIFGALGGVLGVAVSHSKL